MTKRLLNFPHTFSLTILVIVFISLVAGYLEYNYLLIEGLPFREVKTPTLAFLYPYDLVFFVPLILLLALSPTLYQILNKNRPTEQSLKRYFALSIGGILIGLMLKDASWFLFRLVSPLGSDPLAYNWIRVSDYTASFIGSVEILGVVLPIWYLALIPPIAAVFISLLITGPGTESST